MSEILARNVSGKSVVGADGTDLGILFNVTMDLKTGTLHDLIVEPDEDVDGNRVDFDRDEEGRYLIPVNRVQAVKDHIVVDQ